MHQRFPLEAMYPGVGGVSGNDLMKLSSATLTLFKVGMDLTSFGRMLYIADVLEVKELCLSFVLVLHCILISRWDGDMLYLFLETAGRRC